MVKRKMALKDLDHNVAPHGSVPTQEIIPIIVAAIIAISAATSV
ncbi:hypothetical protein [Duganella sp. BuS-21]